MTQRSGFEHVKAEIQAKLQARLARYLFANNSSAVGNLVKKALGADQAAVNQDSDLEHPNLEYLNLERQES